ncbi:MAG: hypothetical protein ABIS18_01745 [Actinomycetota bacterium]
MHNADDCPYGCPLCTGIGLLKQMRPEVGEHLAAAAKEFFLAAKAFMETMAEQGSKSTEPPLEKVWFEDEA